MRELNIISSSVFQFFTDSLYNDLKYELLTESTFIEDVFHETFLSIRNEMIYDLNPSLSKLKLMFSQHYEINIKRYYNEQKQYILLDQDVMDFVISKNTI